VVRRSPRNDSVRLLVSLIVIDAACELVHVAAGKNQADHCESGGAKNLF
jgi:hypothetical protein